MLCPVCCFLPTPPIPWGGYLKVPLRCPQTQEIAPRVSPNGIRGLLLCELWMRCSKVLSYFLLYPFVPAYCDGDIFLPSTGGTFQTPLYPGQYPADLRCIWKIEAAENDKIILRFRWEMSTFYSGDIEKLISATLSCHPIAFCKGCMKHVLVNGDFNFFFKSLRAKKEK